MKTELSIDYMKKHSGKDKVQMLKYCMRLENELEVSKRLLKLLIDSNGKVLVEPIYSLNPSFQVMKCVNGFVLNDDVWNEINIKLDNLGY